MRLKHGQFIGDAGRTDRAAGFSFAEIAHTPAVRVPSHTHDDAHFVLILNGDYVTEARGIGRTGNSPALIFNPPGTTHRDRFRSEIGRFFTISVLPDQFARLSEVQSFTEQPIAFGAGETTTLATRIVREVRHADAFSGLVLEGLGLELLAQMARGARDLRRCSPPGWLGRALDMMRARRCSPLTVREVAAEVGVHPYHLTRVTRAFLGRTPGELLRDYRLEEAVHLLRHSSRTIADIALTCGYADQSQFTRGFKRSLGVPPARGP